MGPVTCHISMSLDGFVAGSNQSVENPIGEGGTRLHQWGFGTESWRRQHGLEGGQRTADAGVLDEVTEDVGAYVMGRKMFGAGTPNGRSAPLQETFGAAVTPTPSLWQSARMADDAAHVYRDALGALLVNQGLGGHGVRLAREVAEVGLRLDQARGGANSRVGRPALLPPGESWPHAAGQRPLTFLAGIDLAELPGNDFLPGGGWLLFFADLDNEDAEGLIDLATNDSDAAARVLYVREGVEPVDADPPDYLRHILSARPVVAVAQLTLPDDDEAAERLGLGPAEAEAYEEVTVRLRYAYGWPPNSADHWLLGAWTGVQGHPAEEDTVLLLHLADDQPLGFDFLDGGAIQFRIPRDALAIGDWSAAVAEADSY